MKFAGHADVLRIFLHSSREKVKQSITKE